MNMKKALLLMGIILATVGLAHASITLDPDLLPSAQGWDYVASGIHAGTAETDVFSTDGTALSINTVGLALSGSAGGSITSREYDGIEPALPTVLEWTSRTLEYENASHPHQHFGFVVAFTYSSRRYMAGINTNQVVIVDGAGVQSIALDATQYHTYRIETVTGSSAYDFYIDNVLQTSSTARSASGLGNISFGDGTGTANARADITALEFTQIPEPGTMGLIGIFAGGVLFVRRFFIS